MKKKNLISVLIVLGIAGLLIFKQNSAPAGLSIQQYTNEVLTKCSSVSHHQSCYDKEVPNLMDKPANLSLEEAFEVTRLVQEKDLSFPYCHVLGHNLSAKEVKKDPSKWKDVLSRCPSGICSNGCIHGGFQERFRAENFTDEQILKIKPDLIDLCEERANWHPTGLEQGSCYHALGHLMMYLTSADINKATNLCEEITIKKDGRDFSHLCFDGSFMQIYQPLEPEDFALIKGKEVTKQTVDSFCVNFEGMRKGSCLSESWPLFSQELQKPEGLVRFCSKEDPSEIDRCFLGMLYILTAQFNFDSQKIHDFCIGLPDERQGRCFADASSRMIETDYRNINKSVDLCQNSQSDSNKDACFKELVKYSTFNFHAGSPEFLKLCNSLPNPWKENCLNKASRVD